ncbi:response regulator [Nonomuraea typhae]|uniref:Response regulator n=1 Tax=Nonomuraea typhae TaxID=2603600 RepID=A0ABW7Z5J5_9ACTN
MVADDQELVRASLRVILGEARDLTVIAEAADGHEAIRLARRLRPDVCLVDIRMPGADGVEVTRALAGPGVEDPLRVIAVTAFGLDEYVDGVLRAGARGYVLKDAGPALLVEAVRAAHAGQALLSPSVAPRLLARLRDVVRPGRAPVSRLSPRESEITRAIARGRTNQEIAGELYISLSTVKGYVSGIQGKLGVRNRTEIAAWAWGQRLLDP